MEDELVERILVEKLYVQNYKSLNNSEVSFKDGLNIVIGKNGAGKSNLLQFLRQYTRFGGIVRSRYSRLMRTGYHFQFSVKFADSPQSDTVQIAHERKLEETDGHELEQINRFEVKVYKRDQLTFESSYSYGNSPGSLNTKQRQELAEHLNYFRSLDIVFVKFYLPLDQSMLWLETPAKLTYDPSSGIEYDEISEFRLINQFIFKLEILFPKVVGKLTDDLEFIKQTLIENFYDYSHKVNLITQIQSYSPIVDLRLSQNINVYKNDEKLHIENLVVEFFVNGNWVPWSHLSDGTKRLFHLITESAFISNGILLIEEPELGIHPAQLYQLMEFIKKKSYSSQVILSTHSPLVLDILEPNELDRIIIAKLSKEGTRFTKLSDRKIHKARKYMKEIGDLSYYWLHSDLEEDD